MNRTVSTYLSTRSLALALMVWVGMWVALGGCATRGEVSGLQTQVWAARKDLNETKSQVARLEKNINEKLKEVDDRLQTESKPLRRNQAAVGAQLDRIELELGRLNGQFEEAAAMNARQGERVSELQQRQMTSTLEMKKALDDLQSRLNRVVEYLGLHELVISRGGQATEEKKAQEGEKVSAPVQTAVEQGPSSAEELYGKTFELFRAGKFQEARAGFATYLERYPETDLADNAQFWLGESYYAEKRYREAIAAYEKTIKQYPKSDKVSSALLKQGMAFLQLGDTTAAKILLKKVVKGYPESNQARIAQSKLAKIR